MPWLVLPRQTAEERNVMLLVEVAAVGSERILHLASFLNVLEWLFVDLPGGFDLSVEEQIFQRADARSSNDRLKVAELVVELGDRDAGSLEVTVLQSRIDEENSNAAISFRPDELVDFVVHRGPIRFALAVRRQRQLVRFIGDQLSFAVTSDRKISRIDAL